MTGTLTFPVDKLLTEISTTKAAPAHHKYWNKTVGPQIQIVGDHGVYLMGNHVRENTKPGESYDVIYANECDPTKMPFDDWYDTKRRVFGGDDGVDLFPVDTMESIVLAAKKAGKANIKIVFSTNSMCVEF